MAPTPYFTPAEIARELEVTTKIVYMWLWAGELKGTQHRGAWRIHPSRLTAFKRRRLRAPGRKPRWVRLALAAESA